VMRQSCIYGQRQFGIEDQGWVAWFVIAAILGRPLTVYGDGKQVRDLLHVRDLALAWALAVEHIDITAGQIYNLGGGIDNAISIWAEFGGLLSELLGRSIEPASSEPWRAGDQPVFICDTQKALRDFGWQPKIGIRFGVQEVVDWVRDNQDSIARTLG
jgi:CDP-paratose 2-epimerase